MKFTNLKLSRECIFPTDNVAHVRSRKTFYHISVNFRNPGFRFGFKAPKTGFYYQKYVVQVVLVQCIVVDIKLYQ